MKNICICATIVACALASVAAPDAAAPAKTAAEKSAAAIKAYQNLSPAEKQAKIRARMERRERIDLPATRPSKYGGGCFSLNFFILQNCVKYNIML